MKDQFRMCGRLENNAWYTVRNTIWFMELSEWIANSGFDYIEEKFIEKFIINNYVDKES